MVNFFHRSYARIKNKHFFLSKLKYYSFLRLFIRELANRLIPIYFNFTSSNPNYRLDKCSKKEGRYIVSLTTFPARIKKIWLVIECILRQQTKPDKIILWLSKQQFSSEQDLPEKLLKLKERGLEIRFVDNDLRSHKKYFYAYELYKRDYIITVDDDVFYDSTFLNTLIKYNDKYPSCVIANHVKLITHSSEGIAPYHKWDILYSFKNSDNCVQIGVGGVLYPPNSLYTDVLNIDLFLILAPLADDLWLYSMVKLNNSKVIKTDYYPSFLPVLNKKKISLTSKNLNEGLNDKQIQQINEHYLREIGETIF